MSEAKTQSRKSRKNRKSKTKTQSKKPQTLAELFLTPGYKYPTNKSRRLEKLRKIRISYRGGAKKRKTHKKRKTNKKQKTKK